MEKHHNDSVLALISILFVLLLAAINIDYANALDINLDNLKKEDIVPGIVDKEPTVALEINYNSGLKVDYGNELTPSEVKDMPTFEYPAEEDKLYTIAMVDPDAPTRKAPVSGPILHFMINNVPGKNVKGGDIMADYVGAGPPMGSGLHRYVFVLYQQPGKVVKAKRIGSTSMMARMRFSLKKYAAEHQLGQPIGVNFFQAKYDDYVPILYKKIMG